MPAGKGKTEATEGESEASPVAVPLTLDEQVAALEASIAADQAQLAALVTKRDFQEFPKMVKGVVFASREEQDAAGPEYAEV